MSKIDFFLEGNYLVIPNLKDAKVFLLINDTATSKISFELYNPFSLQGKLYKFIVKLICLNFNNYVHLFFPTTKKTNSEFIEFLQKLLNKKLSSSLYISTEKDKIVLQVVSSNKILGYVKYPLNEIGAQRLSNERNALEILSKNNLFPQILISEVFKNRNFLLLENISGQLGYYSRDEYYSLLTALKRTSKFKLTNHPRVVSIKKEIIKLGFDELQVLLDKLLNKSLLKYQLVYEHGDFAPWNIKKTDKGLVLFDFEYFVENGIQYFDELKYHFQYYYLIKKLTGKKLINVISKKVRIQEFNIIFCLYLLKEIIIKIKSSKPINLEISLIKLIKFKV